MAITLNGTTGITTPSDTTPIVNSTTTLQLQTGGTTAITVDASQNVGIGTASPTQLVNIVKNQNAATTVSITNSNAGSSATSQLLFGNDTNIYISGLIQNSSTNTTGGGVNSLNVYQGFTSPMTFLTSGVERMRIDAGGNVLIGATSLPASATLANVIYTTGSFAAKSGYFCHAGSLASTFGNQFNINWTGSSQLWIDSTNIGTFAFTSDYRVKRNIETQTLPALERLMALRPVTYQMADYGTLFKASDAIKEGFIAHEVQEVIPSGAEGIKDDENQIQSLRVDAILAVAVKAIQELKAIVDTQAEQIKALQGASI